MADLPQKTVAFNQTLVSVLKKILGPFALPGQKAIRDDYYKSLGLDPKNTPEPETGKVDSFLAKKAEEADDAAFNDAMAQLNTIIVGLEDIVISMVNASSFKQGADDVVTALLNMLTVDYIRREHRVLHNIFFMLQTTNGFANRGGGIVSAGVMIGKYFEMFGRAHNLEDAQEARRFGEVYFLATTIAAFLIDDDLDKKSTDTALAWEIGGQYGYEGGYVADILPIPANATDAEKIKIRRDHASQMLNRIFAFSVNYNNALLQTSSVSNYGFRASVMPLAKTDGGRGVQLVFDSNFEKKAIPISDDWFVSLKAAPSASLRIGTSKDEESADDLSKSSMAVAIERLLKAETALDKQKSIFSIFRIGLGDMSFQLEISPKDFALRSIFQMTYGIVGTKNKGFPLKHLPEKQDKFKLPIRFSLKNGFGFDGNFISTRPADKPQPQSLRAKKSTRSTPSVSEHFFTLPIHKSFGFGQLDKVKVGFGQKGEDYSASLLIDFTLNFSSVVVISVAEIGISLVAKKRTQKPLNGGFLGYDIKPDFAPPKGVGILIDATVVKGGGFLYFNEPHGEYFGAVQLAVKDLFDLKAIGIIRTRDDAGRERFSLLILISAEFKPIQLGFGFTLNGVGGLLALNRRANVQYLQEGLSSGVLQDILFPKNVIADMNRIIGNLNNAFPIQDNRFAVGLMAKFAWGTPAILTLDLGIIVEFPDVRILLPGILRASLPNSKAAIVKINAAFIGILDFKNKFVYFRAELFDSYILTFRLSGSLAFGISWGDPSVFVLSAGGFHPRFREIPSLPTLPNAFKGLNRLRLQLTDSENPRIIIESYFAVTSNTVQFGGKIEFFYDIFSGEGGYNVYGRLQVDVLFQFKPFYFVMDIAADLALRDGLETVMGISINGTLEGPTPWHVRVTACVEIFWWLEIEVELEKTWGNTRQELPTETAKVSDLLRGAVLDKRNWQTLIQGKTGVSFRKEDEKVPTRAVTPDLIQLDPSGGLKFSQSIVPLDFTLQKFGNQLSDISRASISAIKLGDTTITNPPAVNDLFSPEMFTKLNDDERLSRPSFERMKSGFEIAGTDSLSLGSSRQITVNGEVSEANRKQLDKPNIDMATHFRRVFRTSSATFKSEASLDNRSKNRGFQHLAPKDNDRFAIARKDNLTKAEAFKKLTFSSFAEANDLIQRLPKSQQKELQVIENQEFV